MNLNADLWVPYKGKPETMKCKEGKKERKGNLENRGSLGLHLWCAEGLLSATNTIRKSRKIKQELPHLQSWQPGYHKLIKQRSNVEAWVFRNQYKIIHKQMKPSLRSLNIYTQ